MSHLVTPFFFVGEQSCPEKRRIRSSTGSAYIHLFRVVWRTGPSARPSHSHHVVRKPGLGLSSGLRGRKTGRPGEECKPREGRGGQAEGEVPRPGPEARRLRLPDEETTERAKVLRLGRLQHGQGQDEEASPRGGARQEPGDRRPHPHAAGPAPAEVLLGDEQASRLACVLLEAPSLPPGDLLPHQISPVSLPMSAPSPYLLFSSPGTTGFYHVGQS